MKPLAVFFLIVVCVLFLLLALINAASATPLTGGFQVVGNFMPNPGPAVPGGGVLLNTTTGINFTNCNGATCVPASGQNPSPGTAGQFLVIDANGDFASLLNQVGDIKDFSFSGPGSVNFPNTPIAAFESIAGLTFDLATVSIVTQTASLLELAGTGIFHLAGFDDTFGTWSFNGQQSCNVITCPPAFSETFLFTSTNLASIPEPSVLLLIGVGLIVVAAQCRNRMSK